MKNLWLLLLTILLACGSEPKNDPREAMRKALDNGNHAQALELTHQAEESELSGDVAPEFFLLRGVAHYGLHQYDSALEDFNRSLKLDNSNYRTYLNRGLTNAALEQWEAAVSDYSDGLALNDHVADLYLNRGQANFAMRRFEPALSDLDASLKLAPGNTVALYNRGFTYFTLRSYAKAREDLEKVTALDPENAEAHFRLGLSYLGLDDKAAGCSSLGVASGLGHVEAGKIKASDCK